MQTSPDKTQEFDAQNSFTIPTNAQSKPQQVQSILPQKKAVNHSSFGSTKKISRSFFSTSIFLSFKIAIVGIITFLLSLFPLQKVFSGEWKVRQGIDLLAIEKLQIGSPDWILPLSNWFGDGAADIPLYFESTGFPISIRFYALVIFIGLVAGYILALQLAKRSHVATTIIDRMCIGLIVFGLVGARLFFVAFNWDLFSQSPENIIFALPQGGLSIFGAFIGAFLYLLLYIYRFRFNLWEFLDILAPSVLLGQVIGRWGNFFNYEAYGPATSVYWKMYVPTSVNISGDITENFFHPTFLYEIVPNFILLMVIVALFDSLTKKRSGLVFGLYAMGYGLIRFVTEFYRLDALKFALPIDFSIWIYTFEYVYISQILALLLAIGGYYVYVKRKGVFFIRKSLQEININ